MRSPIPSLLIMPLLAFTLCACGDKADDDTAGGDDTAPTACEDDERTLTVTLSPEGQRIQLDGARVFVRLPSGDDLEGIADAAGVVGFTLEAGGYLVRAQAAPGESTAESDPRDVEVSACEDTAVTLTLYGVDG